MSHKAHQGQEQRKKTKTPKKGQSSDIYGKQKMVKLRKNLTKKTISFSKEKSNILHDNKNGTSTN